MNNDNEAFKMQQLLELSKAKEKKASLVSILFVVLILGLTTTWLFYTSNEVSRLTAQKNKLELEKKNLDNEILLLRNKLDSSSLISRNMIDVDMMNVKHLFSENVCVANLLTYILQMKQRNTTFSSFNSPAFMSRALNSSRVLFSGQPGSNGLLESFPAVNSLQTGDIIIYKSGYTMLYVKHNQFIGRAGEYCIGMTPWGILALKKDFAEVVMVKRPAYRSPCN